MADKLSFALVSPEREVFHGDVDHVVVPGSEGEFGVSGLERAGRNTYARHPLRRAFLWISFGLCNIVITGIVEQLYLIAAWIFGESGALTAHKDLGAIVHPIEILVFLVGLAGWWGRSTGNISAVSWSA